MLLSEIYRAKLDRAKFWSQEAKMKEKPLIRQDFYNRRDECEFDADDIAHCIAAFGDIDTDRIETSNLRDISQGWSCSGGNAWHRGLDAIEAWLLSEAMDEADSLRPASPSEAALKW